MVKALRPKQWVKNVLVLAAPAAAGGNALFHGDVLLDILIAFVVFCLGASSIYLINDARDVDADRAHPTKRFRPIAAGVLPVGLAYAMAVVLIVAAVGLSFLASSGPELAIVIAVYIVLQLGYCFGWKHQPVIDIALVSSGFMLRTMAGGVAADIDLSQWFLLIAAFGSLFMAAGKRYAELKLAMRSGAKIRKSLESYTPTYLRLRECPRVPERSRQQEERMMTTSTGKHRSATGTLGRKVAALIVAVAAALGVATVAAPAASADPRNTLGPRCTWASKNSGYQHYVQDCWFDSPSMGQQIKVQIKRSASNASVYMLDGLRARDDWNAWTFLGHGTDLFTNDDVNVIMPVGGASQFYTDWQGNFGGSTTPQKPRWETFLTKELPKQLQQRFGLSPNRNALVGLSMGATAALTLGSHHRDQFKQVTALSPYTNTSNPAMFAALQVAMTSGSAGANVWDMWGAPMSPAQLRNDPTLSVAGLRGMPVYLSAADWDNEDNGVDYKWESFLTEELPAVLREGWRTNEQRAITGLSMSGTAAMNLAEHRPDLFQFVASFSGYLDTTSFGMPMAIDYAVNDTSGLSATNMWGPYGSARWNENDPKQHVDKLKDTTVYVSSGNGNAGAYDTQGPVPGYPENPAAWGLEAMSMLTSRTFVAAADAAGVDVIQKFRPSGTHNWPYWQYEMTQAWQYMAKTFGMGSGDTSTSCAPEMYVTGRRRHTPETGAVAVKNDVMGAWGRQGYENGPLGFPTAAETGIDGGAVQKFENGAVLRNKDGRTQYVQGVIAAKYLGDGGPAASGLGFPTSDERKIRGGAFSVFDSGNIYWSGATGAHSVARGDLFRAWGEEGYEQGRFGFPTSDETEENGVRRITFQHGEIRQVNGNIEKDFRG
ncbi:hypothetical protein KR215_011149 [Drosophila sulfurigaster]|nr:hypothetical protein KR215_011149 [Drosophila sulfurigaster]